MGNTHGGKGASGSTEAPFPDRVDLGASSASTGCPVKSRNKSPISESPLPPPSDSSGCPVKSKAGSEGLTVYNVYAQPIDPTNQMPANANNKPAPGQITPLSTDRVVSRIPKGGTEAETWTYPSPQMFWNALVRKGKAEGANEEDMDVVVAIHNNMNENTWRKVLEWEALNSSSPLQMDPAHSDEANTPRLSRFLGRPDELSPKAWFKSLFGHPLPFDRHDWVIQRQDGTEVRYVIDYYHDDAAAKENQVPKDLVDANSIKSISVDVRPALDSVHAFVDRGMRMPMNRVAGSTHFQPLPFFWTGGKDPAVGGLGRAGPGVAPFKHMANVGGVEKEGSNKAMELSAISRQVHDSCAENFAAMQACTDEASCARAAVKLSYCMGGLLCKKEAAAFDEAVGALGQRDEHDEAVEAAFARMQRCLDDFEAEAQKSRK